MKAHSSILLGSLLILGIGTASPAEETPEQVRFFESQVRPLLVKHCIDCHGPKKQEAALRLDSRVAVLKGADTGPVAVPGEPDKSRMIEVLHYPEFDTQMPPSGKLSAEEIATFTEWIQQGAPWGEETAPQMTEKPAQPHWAFQPIAHSPIPAVNNSAWCETPIDRFILAQLETKGLAPSPQADRRTLIRRATFDLLGVPPSPQEVEDFLNDPSPFAWETVVDRLLASPLYGERWGRHWLDIARYADSKGYVFTEEERYPFSYTYRDYVVRALNADTPYDQFILEQLAADRLNPEPKDPSLAALGFLTVGQRFRNNQHDIIDDRIDLVSRGLMGVTLSCARCHDHKFDPLTQADYYSLYGVFASSYEPEELPLVGEPVETPAYREYVAERERRQAEVSNFRQQAHHKTLDKFRHHAADYLQQVVKVDRKDEGKKLEYTGGDPKGQVVNLWRSYLSQTAKQFHPVWAPWHELNKLPGDQFAARAPEVLTNLKQQSVNPQVMAALESAKLESQYDVAKVYGTLLSQTYQQWQQSREQAAQANQPKPDILPEPMAEELRQVLVAEGGPLSLSEDETSRLYDRDDRDKLRNLEKKVEELAVTSPAAPPRAMVMLDKDQPYNPYVFLRGDPGRRGDNIPRQFPAVLREEGAKPFDTGSGRLELAQSIVDPDNPLTARVMVNRLWQHHFGKGFVLVPDDFGTRSDPPSHPELLDYLAGEFIRSGWSLKAMHREMLLSATYQQQSVHREDAYQVDPENRLLWKMPKQRLEFEAMRDSMLFVSGALSPGKSTRPIRVGEPSAQEYRSIYLFVDRNNLPNLFRTFDYANPDATTAVRPQTTVPQQALFALNSPFVLDQARRLAARPEITSQPTNELKLQAMYQLAYQRPPRPEEQTAALQYIEKLNAADPMEAWAKVAQVLLASNEFLFID